MSPIVEFTDEDFLRGKIVTPGWYRVRVNNVMEKPAKGDNPKTTKIFPMEGTILYHADSGSEEFSGVPTPPSWNFNNNPNASGFILGFLKAVTGDPEFNAKRAELKATEGKEVDVYIDNDTFNGRVVNRINHVYRTPRTAQVNE